MTTIADPITPPRVITQEFRTPAAAIPSFCIGVLPSAATIGLAAPVLLLVFRVRNGVLHSREELLPK